MRKLRAWAAAVWDALPRPLDPVRSIKLKLALLVLGAVTVAMAFFWWQIEWIPPRTTITALLGVLIATQLIAHGMTKPLRDMTSAAIAMADGDYQRRVRATSKDEVGQLAAAFNRMSAELGAADQQRRELIANVSHELRTPITALRAVLENVVDGVTQPDSATMRTALAQTERLGLLVTELLDLSRIDAGALTLNREQWPLAPILAQAVAETEVMTAVAGRGVRFTMSVEPDAVVLADQVRLHQVLVNLLDNAARHGPPGGRVWISATSEPESTVIEVRDEGPGIPVAERDRVFERFTRGERAGGGGTGLGLAIARWVVDLHGGTISAVGPDSGGCRIRVMLPNLAD